MEPQIVQGATPAEVKPEVSVIIKTLNEEANIARAIKSAMAAVGNLSAEIIVADSLSTDSTVEIASRYPVTVVQLINPRDRCCGVGPQLGFQYAQGEFVYILDGDMEMYPDFLPKAVEFLRGKLDVAGVAGLVEELGGGNYEFEARKTQGASWGVPGVQKWLDMGGLYSRSALEAVGYFSNRNLHACEEEDLGLRLGEKGMQLVRLPIRSVRHYGRSEDSFSLMKRRLVTRYSDGPGELVRSMLGTSLAWRALYHHGDLAVMATVWLAIVVGLLLAPWTIIPLAAASAAYAGLGLMMLIRKRSISRGLVGIVNWQMRTAGFVRGLLRPQISPRTPVQSQVIATAAVKEDAPVTGLGEQVVGR